MYYKMRILPVIFLFSMMTKAQDKVVLGFLIHGVKLDFYIDEPIYLSVYHVFWGGARLFLTGFFFDVFFVHFGHIFSPFWHYLLLLLNFSSMVNLILVTFLPVLIGSNSMFISVNSLISDCAFSRTNLLKSGNLL